MALLLASSWESAVLMAAARMAERSTPEMNAGNRRAHHVHKDEVLVVDLAEELAADQADDGGHGQNEHDPAAADDLALAHLMLGLEDR